MKKPLLTKIRLPQTKTRLLTRPRLLSLLESGREYPLTLISAGTGFGKTTLLVDFAHRAQLALSWYSLDESDRDPAVFCNYLLYSVRQVYPSFGRSFEQLLAQNLKDLHQEPIIQRLVEEFIADLELLSQEEPEFRETLLVLDDFQFAESFGVNRFVQRLIWWLPAEFHIIIATRSLPEDLMLSKLLAKQMVTIIGSGELAFTPEEVYQLLSSFYGVDDRVLSERLATYSEGWITAIILALSNHKLTQNGSAANWQKLRVVDMIQAEEVFSYLAQEVLENQTPEIQTFLLKTSVLKLLNPPICDALLEADFSVESESLLRQLESRNLFVTRINSDGQNYYQYHALFGQFLRDRLKQSKALYRQTELRAAQLQKEAGNYVDAIQHYAAAEELTLAATLLNEVVERLYEAGQTSLIAGLLESLPPNRQASLPHVLSIKAKLFLERGESEEALKYFAQAEQIYRQQSAPDYAAKVAGQQAQILIRTSRRSEASTICQRILADTSSLMATPEGQLAVAFANHGAGWLAQEEGQVEQAEKYLTIAAKLYQANQAEFHVATIETYFGLLYQHIGRLIKSTVFYERALKYFIKVGNRSREAYCRINLAINSYQQGQYPQAENQINEVLALMQLLDDQYLRLYALAYLANIYRDTERCNKADEIYLEALELAQKAQVRRMELALLNDRATNFILLGKKEEADRLTKLSRELAEQYELPERAGLSYLNQSWLELGNRSYKRALGLLEKAVDVFRTYKARPEEARASLNLATVLLEMNEPRKSLVALSQSLELSDDLGFEPFLPFELKWATPVFEYAARKKNGETVETFLRRHGYLSYSLSGEQSSLPEPIPFNPRNSRLSKETEVLPEVKIEAITEGLRAYALTGGRVWKAGSEIEDWRNTKAREALFYLLEYKKCSRDELIEALWSGEGISDNTTHVLHNILSILRKAIGPSVLLKLSAGRYYLEGETWYDAAEFSDQIQLLLAQPSVDPVRLTACLDLYKRDFLDQFYSNWVIERQQQLLQLYLKGLEKLAIYYQEHRQYQLALPIWQQVLVKDQYNEEAYRATIACLLALGKRVEALQQSRLCLKALDELDLRPSPETSLLLQKLA